MNRIKGLGAPWNIIFILFHCQYNSSYLIKKWPIAEERSIWHFTKLPRSLNYFNKSSDNPSWIIATFVEELYENVISIKINRFLSMM